MCSSPGDFNTTPILPPWDVDEPLKCIERSFSSVTNTSYWGSEKSLVLGKLVSKSATICPLIIDGLMHFISWHTIRMALRHSPKQLKAGLEVPYRITLGH